MTKQLHKKFTDSQVKEFIERYLRKKIEPSKDVNLIDIFEFIKSHIKITYFF